MSTVEACPDERELALLAEGQALAPRGAALREHIGDCEACRMVVAELASTPSDAPPPPDAPSDARYELARLVGAGGMGEVFVARDTVLGRDVAIKFLREDTSSAESLARSRRRVLREARALASFTHPNVVAVYDQGVLDGRAFLAMEYVRGRTLRQWIKEEAPERARLLEMLVQAGRGLFAAHEVGLVHRDFKPDNVLVGEDGRARVTDFGLACAAPEAMPAPGSTALGPATQTSSTEGGIAGTPAYMAPEQLEGRAADARSDQYAYCVTFFEAIHGERPGAGARPDASRANEAPSPDPVDRVLERGLSEDPSARYASMRELLGDVVAASSPPARSRRPRGIVLGLAAAALLASTLVVLRHRVSAGSPAPTSQAAGAGRAALHEPCTGVAGACEAPLMCSYHAGNYCGASGTAGICAFPSDGCTAKSTAVCGCDGITYKNNCDATSAGVSTAYRGSCVPCAAGSACGDVNAGGLRSPAFCHVDPAPAAAAAEGGSPLGVCWPRPSSCTAGRTAVCGWDGLTYENACEARRAGTDAAREGACSPQRQVSAAPRATEGDRGGGGLSFGEPDDQGMDARPLMNLAKWVRADDLPVYSILVSRNGEVVFELYAPGVSRDQAEYLWGLTSIFTTTLVGVAVDRHLVASPETSIAEALPASLFPTPADRERFRTVTIRDVLSMAALHAPISVLDTSEAAQERQRAFLASPNRLRFALEQPLVAEPGVTHESTDVNGMISAAILALGTHRSLVDFGQDALFGPLGFEHVQWMHEDQLGLENGTYGLRVRPVDVQKLGLLYLQHGTFDHKCVLSSDWALRTFTPVLKSSPSLAKANIGWGWWEVDFGHVGDGDAGAPWVGHLAAGLRGQRLVVFPAQGVVLTVTGLVPPDEEVSTLHRIVRDYVMPSVDGTGAAPAAADPAQRAELHALLEEIHAAPVSAAVAALRAQHPDAVPSIEPKGRPHRPLRLTP